MQKLEFHTHWACVRFIEYHIQSMQKLEYHIQIHAKT